MKGCRGREERGDLAKQARGCGSRKGERRLRWRLQHSTVPIHPAAAAKAEEEAQAAAAAAAAAKAEEEAQAAASAAAAAKAEEEAQAAAAQGSLSINSAALNEQLARLRGHLETCLGTPVEVARASVESARYQELVDTLSEPGLGESELIHLLQKASADQLAGVDAVSVLRCDAHERIVEGNHYVGLGQEEFLSAHASVLHPMLAERIGHRVDVLADRSGNGSSTRVLSFGEPGAEPAVMVTMARRGPDPWSTSRYATLLRSGGQPC